MDVRSKDVAITTAAGGGGSGATEAIRGRLDAIVYTPDGSAPLLTGATVVIASEKGQAILTITTSLGTATRRIVPRQPTHLNADGVAALYAAAGTGVLAPFYLANEVVTVTVTVGGAVKSGTFTFIYS